MSQDSGINAAILNYCAKAGGDSTERGPAVPDRPESDYHWLREAMAAVESPERKLKKMLQFVEALNKEVFACGPPATRPADSSDKAAKSSPNFANDEEKRDYLMDVLEELSDMVEDINWATEFALMDGPQVILTFLANIHTCEERELRERTEQKKTAGAVADSDTTSDVAPPSASAAPGSGSDILQPILTEVTALLCMAVAHASQLNERLQAEFLRHKWPATLIRVLRLEMVKEEAAAPSFSLETSWPAYLRPSAPVVAAALHACSCLCRESPANTIVFLQEGGMDVLITLLRFADGARRPLLTNKILGRIFFFAAYLAESGISAEELMELICRHAEVPAPSTATTTSSPQCESTYSTVGTDKKVEGEEEEETRHAHVELDDTAERAAATALLATARKSPKVVKEKTRANLPLRLREWSMLNDTEDPRRQLVDELSKSS